MLKALVRARPAPGLDLRPVLFVVGVLTLVVGAAMVIPGAGGLALSTRNGPAFLMAAAVTIAIGGFLVAGNRVPVPQMTLRQIYILRLPEAGSRRYRRAGRGSGVRRRRRALSA